MSNETAIQILQAHNDCRRGEDTEMPSPVHLGMAIDHAINELKVAEKNKNILEILNTMYEQERLLRNKYEGKQNGYRFAHRVMALRDLLKKINT